MTTDEPSSGPAWHNWTDDGPPSVGVVEAVAAATGRDPLELPALSETIDPDALNSMLAPDTAREASGGNTVQVTFEYAGVVVLVDSTGLIEVRDDIPSRK
jgi:hypothetical protein